MKKTIRAEFTSFDVAEHAAIAARERCKNVELADVYQQKANPSKNAGEPFTNLFTPSPIGENGTATYLNGIIPETVNLLAIEADNIPADFPTPSFVEITLTDQDTKNPLAVLRSFGGINITEY